MTRLYIELHPGATQPVADEIARQEFVMQRAKEILHPFKVEWKSIGKRPISKPLALLFQETFKLLPWVSFIFFLGGRYCSLHKFVIFVYLHSSSTIPTMTKSIRQVI